MLNGTTRRLSLLIFLCLTTGFGLCEKAQPEGKKIGSNDFTLSERKAIEKTMPVFRRAIGWNVEPLQCYFDNSKVIFGRKYVDYVTPENVVIGENGIEIHRRVWRVWMDEREPTFVADYENSIKKKISEEKGISLMNHARTIALQWKKYPEEMYEEYLTYVLGKAEYYAKYYVHGLPPKYVVSIYDLKWSGPYLGVAFETGDRVKVGEIEDFPRSIYLTVYIHKKTWEPVAVTIEKITVEEPSCGNYLDGTRPNR